MFEQLRNIDTAFRYIRGFTIVIVSGSIVLCTAVLYHSYALMRVAQHKVFILANGKAVEAFAADRAGNIGVEARDHIAQFHHYFFTLDPDDRAIQVNINRALYLADQSAREQYTNLKENGYYAGIISGNISQQIDIDTITVNTQRHPYDFRCRATERITRTTSIVYRELVTEGTLRSITRSDNNPHGFIIERWKIVSNRDIKTESR